MAQEYGSVALLTMGRQTVYETAATGNFLQLPIISVDGGLTQELYESEALQGNRNPPMPSLDEKTVELTIVIQVDVRSIGFVLSEIFGLPTTSGAGPFTHVWKVGNSIPIGVTLEKYFAINGLPIQYIGCKINGFSFELTTGGALKMTLSVIGREAGYAARIDAAPFKYALSPMRMPAAELHEAGVRTKKATRFSLDFTNSLEAIRCVASDGVINDALPGYARPTFGMDMILENMTMANKAINGTESSLKTKFPSDTNAAHYLQIELNEVRYKVMSPPIKGPGGVTVPLDGTAYYDNDAAASAIVVTAVNDVTAYTSITA